MNRSFTTHLPKIMILLALFGCSCAGSEPDRTLPEEGNPAASASWRPPPAGTVVDSLSQKITEDKLNAFYFTLMITSLPESLNSATYDLRLTFGRNSNHMQLQLPEWTNGVILRPEIREGKGKYHCFVGFFATDTTFHPLYEVRVKNKDIHVKQIHAYYLR